MQTFFAGMGRFLGVSLLALGALSSEAQAYVQSCYDDHSLPAYNRLGLPGAVFPGLPALPQPDDCGGWPALSDRHSEYLEVRASPEGVAAILTRRGRLLVTRQVNGQWSMPSPWNGSLSRVRVQAFVLTRDGTIAALNARGELLLGGSRSLSGETITALRASRSGQIIALSRLGRLFDSSGRRLRVPPSDPVVDFKISPEGRVFYLTQNGRLGALPEIGWLHGGRSDRVVDFQVSESGDVAYLTQSGRLYRNRERLRMGSARVRSYRIDARGGVSAWDTEGRAYAF